MISVFRKRQKANYQLYALQSVKNKLDYKLHLLADYLSKKSERLSPRKVALLIITSCVLLAACFSYIAITSAPDTKFIEVQNIRAPAIKQTTIPDGDALVLKRIIRFHKCLDSLKQYDSSYYQTIVNQRPHLIDSLVQAEQFLHSKHF